MSLSKLENVADYGDIRLNEIMVDRNGINPDPKVTKILNDYEKVVNNLLTKMETGTLEQIKKCAKSSNSTKLIIQGREPTVKTTANIGNIFDKYVALIDYLVDKIKSLTKTRSRNVTRRVKTPFR
jgi:hypothetical protein